MFIFRKFISVLNFYVCTICNSMLNHCVIKEFEKNVLYINCEIGKILFLKFPRVIQSYAAWK